jgi:GcrA cell cycle regulator
MSWTDERIERLKAMWTEGKTASQIAEELGGVSRNAVIGKAHRLGLDSRPSPVKPGEDKTAAAASDERATSTKAREKSPIATILEAAAPMPDEVPLAPEPEAIEPAPDSRGARSACGQDRDQPRLSLHRSGRLHPPGPGRAAGADSACPAAPPRARQACAGDRGQDQPARPQRPHLQVAGRSPG